MGDPEEDGSVRMLPLTHELLSEDVGTTREIVSQYMNQFRKQGYLQYSRKGIVLHRDAFQNWFPPNRRSQPSFAPDEFHATTTGSDCTGEESESVKQWKIVHQMTPLAYTAKESLVVETPSKEAAFAVAYDHLTRRGSPVRGEDEWLRNLGLDVEAVRSFGVPNEYGSTHIQWVSEYNITAQGRVVIG